MRSTYTTRHNGKCKVCKRIHTKLTRTDVERSYRSDRVGEVSRTTRTTLASGGPDVATVCCDRTVWMRPVVGHRRPEIECGPKCTGATGHVCECACGGKNHGAGHAS